MKHLLLAFFAATLLVGFLALFQAFVVYRRTKDRIVFLFLSLFTGLSVQLIAQLALAYERNLGFGEMAILSQAGFALVGFSVFFMAFCVGFAVHGFFSTAHRRAKNIVVALLSALFFVVALFSFQIDLARLQMQTHGGKFVLLWLPLMILYALVQGVLNFKKMDDAESKNTLRVLMVLTALAFPFFCFSVAQFLVADSLALSLDMFFMVPLCFFYLAVSVVFLFFVHRKYFRFLDRYRHSAELQGDPVFFQKISPREKEIARLLIQGKDNKTIAYELGLSVHTVKVHVSHIFQKLKVQSRFQLMQKCWRPPSLHEKQPR